MTAEDAKKMIEFIAGNDSPDGVTGWISMGQIISVDALGEYLEEESGVSKEQMGEWYRAVKAL